METEMTESQEKIALKSIGFFATNKNSMNCLVVIEKNALIVCKNHTDFKGADLTVLPVKICDVLVGMSAGAWYAFDKDSWKDFYKNCKLMELDMPKIDWDSAPKKENNLLVINLFAEHNVGECENQEESWKQN